MRIKFYAVCSLLMAAFLPSEAQWTQNTTLEGGSVTALAKISSTIFCASNGGVFSSSNNGTSWTFKGEGIGTNTGSLPVSKLLVNGTTLYAIGGKNFSKTTDNGTTWTSSTIPLKANNEQMNSGGVLNNTIYLACGRPMQQFGGGGGGGAPRYIFKTTDGSTFTEMTTLPEGAANGVISVYGSTLYILADSTVHSYDGTTFTKLSSVGLPAGTQLSNLSYDGTSLFITSLDMTTFSASIYKYNTITGWATSGGGLPAASFLFGLKGAGSTLFVSSYDLATATIGLYRSTDGGITWVAALGTGLSSTIYTDLLELDGTTIMGAFGDGNFSTSDKGTTWTKKNSDLLATNHSQFVSNGTALIAAHNQPFSLLSSTDNGVTYGDIGTGLPAGFNTLISAGENLYASFRANQRDSIITSSDMGVTWEAISTLPEAPETFRLLASNGNTIFLRGTSQGNPASYYTSIDGGNGWETISVPSRITTVNGLVGNGSTAYVWGRGTTSVQTVYNTINDGAKWSIDTAGLGKSPRNVKIALSDKYAFLVYTDSVSGVTKLFASGNGKWQNINATGLPANEPVQQFSINKKALYINTVSGVYTSIDGGKTFSNYSTGLYSGITKGPLAFTSSNVFLATTGNGIWKNASLTGTDPEGILSGLILVKGNVEFASIYPNPSNSTTTVEFGITKTEKVKIDLFDNQGRLISSLLNEEKTAGTHFVPVQLNGLASGIYTCRISSGSGIAVQKLVVIK